MTDIKWLEGGISSIPSLIMSCGIFLIQSRTANNAKKERLKQARSEMLDIIEGYVVNKVDISVEFITALVSAIQREYGIVWTDEAITTTLFQDVALRLQKSKHLDINQKNEYMAYCHLQTSTLRIESENSLTTSLNQLEESIQTNDSKKSINDIKWWWIASSIIIGLSTFFTINSTIFHTTNGLSFNLIITVAGIGVLVGVLASVLDQSNRKEMATGVTMVGIVVVLYIVVQSVLEIYPLNQLH